MNAMRNLLHGIVLAIWALMGVVFTLKCLFSGSLVLTIWAPGSWWLWFAGYAALTTAVMKQFKSAIAPPIVHASMFIILSALPKVLPFSLLRLGLDLLNLGN